MTPPTAAQITASLTAQNLPAPTPLFLAPILTSSSSSSSSSSSLTSSSRPLAALTATAKHRLLHTSISTNPSPLQPTSASLPANISNAAITATALAADTFVQVLDIQDLGRSRWEQIEALEAERKGETTKGREVIRVVPAEPNGGEASQASSAQAQLPNGNANANVNANAKGPFKLLLQDWKGTTAWAFELKKVERIAMPPALGMGIGCKILLRRGTRVARGTVLLEPACVMVFGGRVESLDGAWKADREQRLRREVEAQRGERDG
ncbi:hypothetical protein LZ554_006412 [Drepanopeziza brunnea f. sp. 'monogermtubi']|nr:hypothetical protein LZ554_006412 [Drepanopeziza brunnea f. sp. 'monogermtubi']